METIIKTLNIIFYTVIASNILFIDYQVRNILTLAAEEYSIEYFIPPSPPLIAPKPYIANVSLQLLLQGQSAKCNNEFYPNCPNTEENCCPKENGECDECCGDLCYPNYEMICSTKCENTISSSDIIYCTGKIPAPPPPPASPITLSSPNLTLSNEPCTQDSECLSNCCGSIGSCANTYVCCTDSKDIFNRCSSQTEYGICNMYDGITCKEDKFCSFYDLNSSDAVSGVKKYDPSQFLNRRCGVCSFTTLFALSKSGCNYMIDEFQGTMLSNQNIWISFDEVQLIYENCIKNCPLFTVFTNACQAGCKNMLDTHIETDQCARYNNRNDIVHNPMESIEIVPFQQSIGITQCCRLCNLNDSCAAFLHTSDTCRFFKTLVLSSSTPSSLSHNYFIKDRQNQPPSPPTPPNPPPSPVCSSFRLFTGIGLINAQIQSNIVVGNSTYCCDLCNILRGCIAFSLSSNECTLFISNTISSENILFNTLQTETYIKSNFVNFNILPPSFPPTPLSPPNTSPPSINPLLTPEILIPIIIGVVLVSAIIVVLFYFCTAERAQATTKVLGSFGSTINNLRGKSKDTSQIIIVPSQNPKTTNQNSNTSNDTNNQVLSTIQRVVSQSSNSNTVTSQTEKKLPNRIIF